MYWGTRTTLLLKCIEHDKIIPYNKTVLIPNARIRYWFEALHYGKYNIVKEPSLETRPDYIVIDINHPLQPPRSRLVYRGEYIKVFELA